MYKHLDKRVKKQYAYILIILQKSCQTINCLIISEILILGVRDFVRIRTFRVRFRTLNTTKMIKSDFLDKCVFGKIVIKCSFFIFCFLLNILVFSTIDVLQS